MAKFHQLLQGSKAGSGGPVGVLVGFPANGVMEARRTILLLLLRC